MPFNVFIDGREGTTGLEIEQHLRSREDVHLLTIDETSRKDPVAKRALFDASDVVVLCLPDDAALEASTLSSNTRLLDASTAHRVAQDWVYGLPELSTGQRGEIATAKCVANPGCYPTGFLLTLRPLVDAGLLAPSQLVQTHAVSGYSGGGKKLIQRYEQSDIERLDAQPYALTLEHKHVPEMRKYAKLENEPLFVPSVGPFYRGMLVKTAFHLAELQMCPSARDVLEIYRERYANEPFVQVMEFGADLELEDGFLPATRCNGTNRVEIMVFGNQSHVLVVAILDNLGKGAATGAVQNLNLMFNIPETTGLTA